MLKARRHTRRVVRDPQPRAWISDEVFGEIPDRRTAFQRMLARSVAYLLPALLLILFFLGLILFGHP